MVEDQWHRSGGKIIENNKKVKRSWKIIGILLRLSDTDQAMKNKIIILINLTSSTIDDQWHRAHVED